jgi:hypothetical protein
MMGSNCTLRREKKFGWPFYAQLNEKKFETWQ